MKEYPPQHPALNRELFTLRQFCTGFFDQFVVDHPARAGGLAGSAIEAEIEMFTHALGRVDRAFRQTAHQLDTAPRGVGFVAGDRVGRAGGEAQPAMDAGQCAVIGARIQLDRGRIRQNRE